MGRGWSVVVGEGVFVQEIDEHLVLFDIESGEYFGLDETGREIWELLGSGLDIEGCCRVLGERYDAPLEVLRGDVESFVTRLAEQKLVAIEGFGEDE